MGEEVMEIIRDSTKYKVICSYVWLNDIVFGTYENLREAESNAVIALSTGVKVVYIEEVKRIMKFKETSND